MQAATLKKQWIVGTAGHIDHGKSALVKALTGADTDQLPQEKERGISIDLGFAPLPLEDGRLLGFVDVPGHERFIKNMVAGAYGMDLLLLVVAADQGVQPQTVEHVHICNLLGIDKAVVAISRIDCVADSERHTLIDQRRQEITKLVEGSSLEGAPIVATSAVSGEGVDALKQQLQQLTKTKPKPHRLSAPFRLYVDRVFSKPGFGTVLTGSGYRGRVRLGDKLQLFPGAVETTLRKIESFLQPLQVGEAGMRLALNLQHADAHEINRGFCLTTADNVQPSTQLLVHIKTLPHINAIKHNSWVRLHWGTAESRARLLFRSFYAEPQLPAGEQSFALIKIDEPVFVKLGDAVILRSQTPVTTIGGGRVLVPINEQKRFLGSRWQRQQLQTLQDFIDDEEQLTVAAGMLIQRAGSAGCTIAELARFFDRPPETITLALEEELLQGRIVAALEHKQKQQQDNQAETAQWQTPLLSEVSLQQLCDSAIAELQHYQQSHPEDPVMNQESLRVKMGRALPTTVFKRVLTQLNRDKKIQQSDDGGLRLVGEEIEDYQTKGKEPSKKVAPPLAQQAAPQPSNASITEKMEALIAKAALTPPNIGELAQLLEVPVAKAAGFIKSLLRENRVVRLPGEFYAHPETIAQLRTELQHHFDKNKMLSLAEFKQLTRTSRKYTLPFLEYFDQHKITLRTQDNSRLPGPQLRS